MKRFPLYQSSSGHANPHHDDLVKLPHMAWRSNNKQTNASDLNENMLEQKLIFPKLSNNPEAMSMPIQDQKTNPLLGKIVRDQYLKRHPSTNKKGDLSMRAEKKQRKELNAIEGVEQQSWNGNNHLASVVGMTRPNRNPHSEAEGPHKKRILTDVTTNDRNFRENSHEKPTDFSYVKEIVKKGSINLSPQAKASFATLEERRRKFPDRKIIRSNYSRPKRLITDCNDVVFNNQPAKALQKSVLFQRSETHAVVSPVSLFTEIQTTLSRKQPSVSKQLPKHRDKNLFFSKSINNPEERIRELENKLKKMDGQDTSHLNTDVAETTDKESCRQHSPLANGESWRHVSVNNSMKQLLIEQSSFLGEVDRLKSYMSRNDDMIQKYISQRKSLIQTVLNQSQITNYLRNGHS